MSVQGWVVALGSLARFMGLGLVVWGGGSIVAAASVWSVVSALTLVVLAILGSRNGWTPRWSKFNFSDICGILRAALPLAVMGSLQMLYYRVDVVMLKSLAGNAPVALYHNAYRLLEAFLMLANMAALSALPALSSRRSDRTAFGTLAEKLLRVLIVGGLLTASVGAAASHALMPFLFGAPYAQGGPVLALLFASAAPFFINALTVDVWTVRNPKRLAVWYMGLLVLNVLLNVWWIPLWGPSGAAAATLVCEGVGVACAIPWILREMPTGVGRRLRSLAMGAFLAASTVWGLSRWWGGLSWILLGPLLFAAILLLSRGVTLGECRAMIRGIRGT
jgi:O-antigen/teichoic acid export membrane protein